MPVIVAPKYTSLPFSRMYFFWGGGIPIIIETESVIQTELVIKIVKANLSDWIGWLKQIIYTKINRM